MDTIRGSWWCLTLNNPTEEERLKLHSNPPYWLRLIKGQDEVGKSGTLHIQFGLNTRQVRQSQIKAWCPRAHIELARNPAAVMNYVAKEDTAVPATDFEHNYITESSSLTMAQALIKLASYVDRTEFRKRFSEDSIGTKTTVSDYLKFEFWEAAKLWVDDDENIIGLITQTQYLTGWVKFSDVWLKKFKAQELDRQTNSTFNSPVNPCECPPDKINSNCIV